MLHFQNLSLRRGGKLLFADASFQIHPGQKVGITGANGTGKSSLFALIRGQLQADAGDLKLPREWVIAWVAQETPQDSRPAMEYVWTAMPNCARWSSRSVKPRRKKTARLWLGCTVCSRASAATRPAAGPGNCCTAWAFGPVMKTGRYRISPAAGACA